MIGLKNGGGLRNFSFGLLGLVKTETGAEEILDFDMTSERKHGSRICWATSQLSYFSAPSVLLPALFENTLLHSHLLHDTHLYPPPPTSTSSLLLLLTPIFLLPPRLLSLDTTINHGDWESCLHWGVIICTVCKLSGHDELATLNRPLLTDTDGGTSNSRH